MAYPGTSRIGCLILIGLGLVQTATASAIHFSLPATITAENNPDNCQWHGMDALGHWTLNGQPIRVDPRTWLTQSPPGPCSAVVLPTGHWIELAFPGTIVDGQSMHPCLEGLPATTDIALFEKDTNEERVVVFLSDGHGRLYLWGEALSSWSTSVPDPNCNGMVKMGLDLADVNVSFEPRAVRILSRDLGGAAPGFDLGRVWARIEPDASASCPWPIDGAQGIAPDVTWTWSPGHDTLGHALYWGSDVDAVLAQTDPAAVFGEHDALSYRPNDLVLGQTVYWRVDTLPATEDAPLVPGPVWSFATATYVTVDDFESYDSNPIFENTWFHEPGTHALAQVSPHPDHPGCQHMTATYDNLHSGSMLERHFDPPLDWQSHPEATELEVSFRGDPNNPLDSRLSLLVGDANAVTLLPGDAVPSEHLCDANWHRWIVPLDSFKPLDLSRITTLGLTVTAGAAAHSPAWQCRMDFDDIRLRRPPIEWPPPGPIKEPNTPPAPPMEPNRPWVWFTFDNPYEDLIGDVTWNIIGQWVDGWTEYTQGIQGKALQLSATEGYALFNQSLAINRFERGISIAFWQNGENTCYDTDTICSSEPQYGRGGPVLGIALGCWERPGRCYWHCGEPNDLHNHLEQAHAQVSEWMGTWNHWVFTKDFRTGRMTVYHNGRLWAEKPGLPGRLPSLNELTVGNGWLTGHDGLLDELRIYDYALSENEAVFLAW